MDDFIVMILLIRLSFIKEKHEYEQACSTKNITKKTSGKKKTDSEVDAKSTGSLSTKESHNPSLNASRKGSEVDSTTNKVTLLEHLVDTEQIRAQTKKRLKKLLDIKNNPDFKICEPSVAVNCAMKYYQNYLKFQ